MAAPVDLAGGWGRVDYRDLVDAASVEMLVLPTLACAFHEGFVVYVSARAMSPSDDDWELYMQFIERRKAPSRVMCALVLERGVGPTLRQRRRLEAVTVGVRVRAAILTNSAFARGITAIVALAKPGYKAFPLDGLAGAFAHIGVDAAQERDFGELLQMLEARLERGRGRPPGASVY